MLSLLCRLSLSSTSRLDSRLSGPDSCDPQSSSSWSPRQCTQDCPGCRITNTTGAMCWRDSCRVPWWLSWWYVPDIPITLHLEQRGYGFRDIDYGLYFILSFSGLSLSSVLPLLCKVFCVSDFFKTRVEPRKELEIPHTTLQETTNGNHFESPN